MIDYAARARANRPAWITDEMHEKAVRELHERHRAMLSQFTPLDVVAHKVIGIVAGKAV
jgi:hypothetical protein